jgi:hypothetical protein
MGTREKSDFLKKSDFFDSQKSDFLKKSDFFDS